MSAQGLKHASDPAPIDKPGSRRRGAAGRAAALRRAPSDSDGSAETASLSADSAERRAPPPPPRSGKTRSRRRGSEWEVLEGLKDGQRFERRPEVFNGFLHKKRKWPLKGWHKRFFVVDGGILVYARSPTDVARGRLHGSLDVGLSVISAKPRRRRIDIDADEFIYHLRAKTPDVFRTWLNVLKAHRLYRQHLLTFGARESVPKIHPPMDDLPPIDASSRISQSSLESFSSITFSQSNLHPKESYYKLPSSEAASSDYRNSQRVLRSWKTKDSSGLIPIEPFDFSKIKTLDVIDEPRDKICGSLCSMYCIEKRLGNIHNSFVTLPIIPLSADEQQMHSTNLDLITLKSSSIGSQSLGELKSSSENRKNCKISKPVEQKLKHPLDYIANCNNKMKKSSTWNNDSDQMTMSVCHFFSRKDRSRSCRNGEQWTMKRSKKSTNLVKYKNIIDEPCLRKPLLRRKILGKHKLDAESLILKEVGVCCDLNKKNEEEREVKSTQDEMTASEYDMISETLIFDLFDAHDENNKLKSCVAGSSNSRLYVNQIVKELYDIKLADSKTQPIKFLFKSLLQYYLKNTQGKFKSSVKRDIAVTKQSNTYFTKDEQLSNSLMNNNHDGVRASKSTINSEQQIEKLIKSTAYSCTTALGKKKETDIAITKALIDNLDTLSMRCIHKGNDDVASSDFSELPQLQETIKHLMSETSLSTSVAKDFLNAYLELLRHSSSKSVSSIADSSDTSKVLNFGDGPSCDIQTDCVEAKTSKCVSTSGIMKSPRDGNSDNTKNPGQLCTKEMLDKMNYLLSCNCNKLKSKFPDKVTTESKCENSKEAPVKDEIEKPVCFNNKNKVKVSEDNTIVIDLSEYDLDNISMSNHATVAGTKCLIVNLKEKSNNNSAELKLKHLSLKFTGDGSKANQLNQTKPCYQAHIKTKSPFMVVRSECSDDGIDLPIFSSSSEATSKPCQNAKCNQFFDNFYYSNKWKFSSNEKSPNVNDNARSYFLSSIKKDMPITLETKKKLKESTEGVFSPQELWKRNERTSKVINETFILRLLENLALLSKEVPAIHPEINRFYLKLKKRHDVTENLSGFSFLGNIYRAESTILPKKIDCETQFDSTVFPEIRHNIKKAIQIAINTSFILPDLQLGLDKALSAIVFPEGLTNLEVQTQVPSNALDVKSIDKDLSPNISEIQSGNYKKEQWLKLLTREYAETAAIKCMLEKYHQLPQSIRIAHPIRAMIPEKLTVPRNSSVAGSTLSSSSPPLKISTQSQTRRIDKNTIENGNNLEVYQLFLNKSKAVRSKSLTSSSVDVMMKKEMSDDLKTLYRCSSDPSYCSESGGPLESASRELGQAQLSVQQLQRLLDALELQQQMHHDTDVSIEGASPNVKKDRRKFGLRKKKSNSKCASVELAPPHVDPSNSHMALSTLTAPPSPGGGASSMPNSAASLPIACAAARPQSLPGAEALGTGGPASLTSLTPDHQLREDFTVLAKDLVANLKTVVSTLVVERGRLRAALEAAEPAPGGALAALRTNLSSALQQNSELRSRLSRIHDASDLAEISSVGHNSDQQASRQFPQSLSYSSSCVSASEFFDAEEHEDELKPAEIIATDEAGVIELDGDSLSEAGSLSSEEGSASSDNSDGATSAVIAVERTPLQNGSEQICSRRARLPCPRPTPASPSLWNLLYKNIGKDLSQISMPVTINEPLNMLQRLCEELEYSELLDAASQCRDAVERMAIMAAFAVSAYAAAAHRAASKPFNPLLAETYECVRPDRDFRFIAEQVSHHPPISACHAESPRWTFWQEARIKTKFWGKSMEFQPTGRVHVRLSPSGDHYSWNKVTTCVHNLFGGQRWVDQYGDMHIVCHGTDISCKLQFIKASSWSSSRHEVRGAVLAGAAARARLAGRWSEGLHAADRPLWRPGAMPPDYELYYGFTRFAMELNELEPGMRDVLPSTDTRFRPDQRALEEGDVDAAEQFKHELEQAQRERRRDGLEHKPLWFRKTVEEGEETWVFTGEYWKAREAGFTDTPRLW